MKMYAVIDPTWAGRKPERYFPKFRDAETYINNCTRYDHEHTMESGGQPGREYLVIKIVERDSQPCKCCGREAGNNPEQFEQYPYCRDCHYVGNAGEDIHLNDLAAFRTAFPDGDVGIEHTGGGCFWLSFRWEDDPVFYCATDGGASLPDDWSNGWGVVCRYQEDENGDMNDEEWDAIIESDFYGDKGPATFLTKRQVIAAIKKDRKARVPA